MGALGELETLWWSEASRSVSPWASLLSAFRYWDSGHVKPCLTFHMDLKDSNSGLLSRRKSALIHGAIFPVPLNINTWNLEGFGGFFPPVFSINNKAILVQSWLDCWGILRYHKNFSLQKLGMDMNTLNPLHLPRGQVSPCRGEMLDLAPHWNGPSSPPASQLWPWQLWDKKCLLLTPGLPLPLLSSSLLFSSS